MKKTLNILSVTDLAVIGIWAIALAVSRLTAETAYANHIAAAFVIIYALAIIAVAAYTVASILLLIKKKEFSLPLLLFTYITNIAWVAIILWLLIMQVSSFQN